ncbi:alpha/beta fold hydrolase [Streptomyces sp. AK010]|uniref:alpha/beta fold hydrolase n=1 Tax=Streptomyces sp. AK010 TaxID=2723074 RepID=UPI0017BAE74B|nr:hypothetical protein [Streptomyces sp. AK010]MBB6421794.1 hypothetical protein [Streptomyces sp. AK010]
MRECNDRIHNTLKNADGAAGPTLHATTAQGGITARSLWKPATRPNEFGNALTRKVQDMTDTSTCPKQPRWTGTVPVEDTALAVTDTGGTGTPVVYLNGQFATQGYWRHTLAELGPGWRHITCDERARGKSKRSADYSFEAAVRDADAVLAARGVDRALLAGPTERSSRLTGPDAIRTAPWARSSSTAPSPTTGSTTPWSSGSGSCSGGWGGCCRCCARRASPRG